MSEKTVSSAKLLENKGARYMQTMGVNIGSIILFGGAGWLLDAQFGTKPLFFIMLFVASFPFSIYVLYKKIMKLTDSEAKNKVTSSQKETTLKENK